MLDDKRWDYQKRLAAIAGRVCDNRSACKTKAVLKTSMNINCYNKLCIIWLSAFFSSTSILRLNPLIIDAQAKDVLSTAGSNPWRSVAIMIFRRARCDLTVFKTQLKSIQAFKSIKRNIHTFWEHFYSCTDTRQRWWLYYLKFYVSDDQIRHRQSILL